MLIEIKHHFDGRVLFAGEYSSLRDAMAAAAKSGADLSGAYLSRADLSGANLSGADLYGADLSGAYLSGAYLYGADLSGADLSRAYLYGANLSRANLSHANLYGANLSDANLSGADLSGANLSGADLSGANLSRADLYGANLFDQSKCVAGNAVVQIGPIGSRGATLVVFNTDKGLRMQTGCFFGDADTFLARVMDTHGTNKHATNYRSALELAASMLENA